MQIPKTWRDFEALGDSKKGWMAAREYERAQDKLSIGMTGFMAEYRRLQDKINAALAEDEKSA